MAALNGYLALGNMDAAGLVFTEISGAGSYARQPVALAPVGHGGVVRNIAAVQFPVATQYTWPNFRAYAVFDSLTSGLQMMAWGIGNVHSVLPGARHSIRAGGIELTFPTVRSNHGSEVIMAGPYSAAPDRVFASLPTITMTQAAYSDLVTKDPNTLYVIVG